MLPLTAPTFIRHNTGRSYSLGRGLKDLQYLSLGIVTFAVSQFHLQAIARNTIRDKDDPVLKASYSISSLIEIRNIQGDNLSGLTLRVIHG